VPLCYRGKAMIRRATSALVLLLAVGVFARPAGSQAVPEASIAFAYESTFGETGTPWQRSDAYLNQPWGIGADGDGIWVANAAGRNLVRYGAGAVDNLGRAGSVDELYGQPARWITDVAVGTAVDGTRLVWLVDQGAHVVVGLVQTEPGPYGPPKPIILGQPGVAGSDGAHFDLPTGIAADGRGHVFVSDTANHRIQVFDGDQTLVATIGRTGAAGSGPDELSSPARLTLSADGRLYIADAGNHRVQAWDVRVPSAPVFAQSYGQAGAPGTALGAFDTPLGVAVDTTFLYVADSGNSRVQMLSWRDGKAWRVLDGVAERACGTGDAAGRWHGPVSDVALDADQNLYVALPAEMRVPMCDAIDRHARGALGARGVPYLTTPELYNAWSPSPRPACRCGRRARREWRATPRGSSRVRPTRRGCPTVAGWSPMAPMPAWWCSLPTAGGRPSGGTAAAIRSLHPRASPSLPTGVPRWPTPDPDGCGSSTRAGRLPAA
jgi:hypothetical protein